MLDSNLPNVSPASKRPPLPVVDLAKWPPDDDMLEHPHRAAAFQQGSIQATAISRKGALLHLRFWSASSP